MENLPIDELLEKRIKAARRGRIVGTVVLIVAALLVIGCICVWIVRGIRNHAAENPPDNPIETQTVDSDGNTESSEAVEASVTPVEGQTEPISTETAEPSGQTGTPGQTETTERSETTEAPEPRETEPRENEPPERSEVPHEMRVVWQDDFPKPDSLEIHVMHDDTELFTAVLNEANQWTYAWTDRYSAQELQFAGNCPEGMSMEYIASGDQFMLKAASVEGKLPQTGINLFAGLFLVLAGMAVTILGLAFRTKE